MRLTIRSLVLLMQFIMRLGDCRMRRFIKTSWLIDVAQLGLEM